jgi:hypothetical protein
MEAVCINGIIDECVDGAAFLTGAIPTAVVAATLLIGASFAERGARTRHRELDVRERELGERRRALERRVGLALGPLSFGVRVAF